MARAKYIWVVFSLANQTISMTAFTVKHELVTSLRGRDSIEDVWVFRVRDNDWRQPPSSQRFTAAELLSGHNVVMTAEQFDSLNESLDVADEAPTLAETAQRKRRECAERPPVEPVEPSSE